MARALAQRMLIRSISCTDAAPSAHARALLRILTTSFARWREESIFESRRPGMGRCPGRKTTAAATTGPAMGPRPTSSSPATTSRPSAQSARSRFSVGRITSGLGQLLDPSRLAGKIAQVIQLGTPDPAAPHQLDDRDGGRVQREDPLHPYPRRNLAHGEALADATAAPRDAGAFE